MHLLASKINKPDTCVRTQKASGDTYLERDDDDDDDDDDDVTMNSANYMWSVMMD